MSPIHKSSDNEESQASQLLQAMLNSGEGNQNAGDMRRLDQGNDPSLTRGSTTDSSPSRTSSSLHYDFHGLGQTQTQYLDEEVDLNESSQKENIGTAKEERLKMSATAANIHAGSSSSGVTKPRSVAVKAVSFQSPQKKGILPATIGNSVQRQPTRSTTLPTTAATSRRHITPILSQDSFGIPDQDPSQQFLATSKQFNVPLSELSKVVLPLSPSTMNPRHHQRRYRRSPSPSEGTVLVESTPSASGGSQSQSYPEAPPLEAMPDLPSGQSKYLETSHPINGGDTHYPIEECLSDAPSSFYAPDHNDESFPSTVLAPTQPSTQVEDNDTMDVEPIHPFDAIVHETISSTGNTSSIATTNSRSLFSMVDPKKRYRYQHLIEHQNQPPMTTESSLVQKENDPSSMSTISRSPTPNLVPSPALETHSRRLVETQPSLDEQLIEPAQQGFPGRLQPTDNLYPRGERSHLEEIGSQRTGVIPGSEPPYDEVLDKKIVVPKGSGKLPIDTHPVDTVEDSRVTRFASEVADSLPEGDSEGNVPLSDVVRSRGKRSTTIDLKGKGKLLHDRANDHLNKKPSSRQRSVVGRSNKEATSILPVLSLDVPAPTSNVRTTRASAALQVYRPPGTVLSWQSGVVPSSIPNEDIGNARVKSCANPTAPKRGNGINQTCAKPKRILAVPAKRSRRRAELDAENSSLSASDDELLIRAGDRENDSSEPADDVDMDSDFGGAISKKRKRSGPSVKSMKTKSKYSKKAKKVASSTPPTRQGNRLRSVTSVSRISDVDATRVFALWKQDSCYYSGTVNADVGGGMYEVYFDDKAIAHVHIDQMRLLDLRPNDDVMIPNIMRGFKVSAVDQLASSQLVSVCLDEGIKEMELVSLRIAAKTISAAWHDRTLFRHSIIPTIKPEPSKASPAPSGFSLTTVPSRRVGRSHVFEKTAFVVSVSSNEGNWSRERENLLSKIKNNGGVLVNVWPDVLHMEGTYSKHNNRWVIRKGEARWIGTESIARIFLVADHPSCKPKFLLALALGVPCLKVEWLYDTVAAGEEKVWLAYMLGQGFSEMLSTQISQQVDINWGTSVHHLTDIMENRVPCKLFSGKSILCVGDVVPKMRNKKLSLAEEKAQEAHNAITHIILAMGADRVEAVTDINYASAPLHEFDFVVIKKAEHYSPELGMVPNKTVHWNWVKECLVASRLLPQLEWELESQEA
ncbi:hypothetical protein H2248_009387 [Termitomyces sp. 'cryptogamus']|nr:hypothetical protein H2248_009387 [Termitomyces sp. 'cryptogamus']